MELWPGIWPVLLLLFLLLLFLLPTLWFCSPSAKYFFKMAFYNGWILFLAVLAIPVCAVRGRNVENMKILRLMLLHIKYLYGIRVEVRGAHHFPPSQPYVVVSNHQSSLDLLGMMEVLPGRCVPIAKRELLWAGSAGLACWLAGVIFIDRKRTGDAISVMSEVAQTLLTQDVRVWVFPEGTRNHNGSMLPFKRGAFHLAVQAQVPIVPIVMSSYQDFYCKKERRFTSAGFLKTSPLDPPPCHHLSLRDPPLAPWTDISSRRNESPPKRLHGSSLDPMILLDSKLQAAGKKRLMEAIPLSHNFSSSSPSKSSLLVPSKGVSTFTCTHLH
uniref:1-acyl-sn-glycerol-3-phosphate acyltransferase n=1 Tax=Felis catus TaxID=9685 RepID=A0ABI8A7E2_FELCA